MHYWFVHAYFTFVVFFSLKFSICQLLLLKQLIFTKIGSIPINHKDCLKYMVRMLQYVLLYMYRITGGNFEGGVHINGFLSIKCVLTFILVDFIFASFNWEGVSKIWYTSSRIVYFFSAINWYYKVEQNYHPVEKSRYTAYFTLVLSMLLHWVPAAFISPFLTP